MIDSDDEFEMRGAEMKETFQHYHKVYHDEAQRLGDKSESQAVLGAVGNGFKKFANNIVSVGGPNIFDTEHEMQDKAQKDQLERLQTQISEKKKKKTELLAELHRLRQKQERLQANSDKLRIEKSDITQKLKHTRETFTKV